MTAPTPAIAKPPVLSELSLEQLMDIRVTSVSKKIQDISKAAAAIHVISREDIRRSGLNTIPELLRMVPGLDVAQIDANKWAISSRGFNDRFANKLLILIDGRSVYNPTFAGAYWDSQDYILEDIERIEVIRGPGGTLWGANAVNGVINIITRKSADTQGALIAASTGNYENADTEFRYGGKINDKDHFRIYAKKHSRDTFGTHDAWDAKQAGFRADLSLSDQDSMMIDGHLREGNSKASQLLTTLTPPSNYTLNDTNNNHDRHVLAKWERNLPDNSSISLQGYYDSVERTDNSLGQKLVTWDLDFHHRFQANRSQEIIWGLGYRKVDDQYQSSFTLVISPEHRNTEVYSAFIQDEIAIRDNLHLTLGSKLEHNSYTGLEIQPNARLLYEAAPNQTYWGAVSRAVQTPSRSYSDMRINTAAFPPAFAPTLLAIIGNPAFESQNVVSAEIGYRNQLTPELNLDMAAFYNHYKNLTTTETGALTAEALPLPAHWLLPNLPRNLMKGETHGVEISANWQPRPDWRLGMGYAWFDMRLSLDPASRDFTRIRTTEGSNPAQQLQLKSYFNLSEKLELDSFLYFVDRLPAVRTTSATPASIPAYTRIDLRLGYRPLRNMELSLSGQNLFDKRHPEFYAYDINAGTVPRTINAKVAWQF